MSRVAAKAKRVSMPGPLTINAAIRSRPTPLTVNRPSRSAMTAGNIDGMSSLGPCRRVGT